MVRKPIRRACTRSSPVSSMSRKPPSSRHPRLCASCFSPTKTTRTSTCTATPISWLTTSGGSSTATPRWRESKMPSASNLLKKVLGVEGLTFQDLKDETYRKRFSHYLPWVTYDPETKVYGCSDDSVGFIFECSPLAFAGEQTMETLEGLVRLSVPSGSVIQFTLLADPYIEPYLNAYKALKTRDSDLTRTSAERFSQFLAEGREGLGKLNGIPVRDFRLVVSAKLPSGGSDVDLNDTRNTIFEILSGANLFPSPMAAEDLIRWMRRLFNGEDYGEEPC